MSLTTEWRAVINDDTWQRWHKGVLLTVFRHPSSDYFSGYACIPQKKDAHFRGHSQATFDEAAQTAVLAAERLMGAA